jgi:folate-binding protein YgfZ
MTQASPEPTVVYERPVDVVTVTGPDAGSFLQSLLSQDLDGIGVGESAPTLLLQPQGKLVAPMTAARVAPDTWWLVTDPGAGEALRSGLMRFRIRVKVEIADASAEFAALTVVGGEPGSMADVADAITVVSALGGVDVVGPRDTIARVRADLDASGADVRGTDAYEAARIAAGVPRLGVDIDDKTIPQEAFLDRDAVSFTKGCFVGQELVCRIDTRGHVNRYLRRLRLETPAPVAADVVVDDKVVGTVTSVADTAALAMIRREVEPPATVTVRWADAETAAVVETV